MGKNLYSVAVLLSVFALSCAGMAPEDELVLEGSAVANATAAYKLESTVGCLKASSYGLAADVIAADCSNAGKWVITQSPLNRYFYMVKPEGYGSLCLAAVPQIGQPVRLASCNPSNTAWYVIMIGGKFMACHVHDTGVCISTKMGKGKSAVIDWRNDGDGSQWFKLRL